MPMPKSLDEFWKLNLHHAKQLEVLRSIILDCGLGETFKWAFPTYTLGKKNVVALGSFKEHYAIWFFQGVYLRDQAKVLTNAQAGKTRAMRHWKFAPTDILEEDLIKTYVLEAIDNSLAGKEVKAERKKGYKMPQELAEALKNKDLHSHFYALTEDKQREYASYITGAKQEATKLKRIEKITPMILDGKGLNDRYR